MLASAAGVAESFVMRPATAPTFGTTKTCENSEVFPYDRLAGSVTCVAVAEMYSPTAEADGSVVLKVALPSVSVVT